MLKKEYIFPDTPPSMDIAQCLKLFQPDGSAVSQNLSPVRKRVSNPCISLIFIQCIVQWNQIMILKNLLEVKFCFWDI